MKSTCKRGYFSGCPFGEDNGETLEDSSAVTDCKFLARGVWCAHYAKIKENRFNKRISDVVDRHHSNKPFWKFW